MSAGASMTERLAEIECVLSDPTYKPGLFAFHSMQWMVERIRELEAESERLKEVEWLARDFVWSCPELPSHPTMARLIQWFDEGRERTSLEAKA